MVGEAGEGCLLGDMKLKVSSARAGRAIHDPFVTTCCLDDPKRGRHRISRRIGKDEGFHN